ncbi:hypothetical protein SRHO_G00050470 [Serrasalmus rhombeus]
MLSINCYLVLLLVHSACALSVLSVLSSRDVDFSLIILNLNQIRFKIHKDAEKNKCLGITYCHLTTGLRKGQ